jgi:hypothetical protein
VCVCDRMTAVIGPFTQLRAFFTATEEEECIITSHIDMANRERSAAVRESVFESEYVVDRQTKQDKKQEQEEYERKVEEMREFVDTEWKLKRFEGQVQRDAEVWLETLKNPGVESRGNILRRLFTVIRYGGLVLRHASREGSEADCKWKSWYETKWPIATTLSHGGRIVIQLPRKKLNSKNPQTGSRYDSHFWKWLITGEVDGDLSEYVSTSGSGDQCTKEQKILFKRLGATHSLDFVKPIERVIQVPSVNSLAPPKEKLELLFPSMPNHRKKVLLECKTSGFNLRDTKMFRGDAHTLKHHRHWGMNIPLG